MAKTSQRVRQSRPAKFKTREYTRCRRCGRSRAVYRKFGVCRICLRELAHNGLHPRHDEEQLVSRMSMTDPIADFLTRIRNAITAAHETVDIPSSGLKTRARPDPQGAGLHRRLLDRGADARAPGGAHPRPPEVHREPPQVISGLKRVSRPGQRFYVPATQIPKVQGGMGTAIVSTSPRGHDRPPGPPAGVGGEVVAHVW